MADPVSLAINAALIGANLAISASQEFEGPRLDDLKVTTADYGTPLNYVWGRRRLDGVSCIWAEPLTEVKRRRKTKGGKFNDYTYYGTWAVALCDHEIDKVLKVWFDRNLVYDATGAGSSSPFAFADDGTINDHMTIYLGTDDQEPDPRMAATVDAEFGEDSTPAYRGVAYIVFKDVPLEKLANRLPQVSVEVATAAEDAFPAEARTVAYTPPMSGFWGLTWSPDRTRLYFGQNGEYQIWDARARALMVSGEFDDTAGTVRPHQLVWGVANDGSLYQIAGNLISMRLVKYKPDGIGPGDVVGSDFGRGEHSIVLKSGDVDDPFMPEYVCIASWSTDNGGYIHQHGAVTTPQFLDTGAATGFDWQIKNFFRDRYGDIWAVGGGGDLADDQLALWKVVDVSGEGGPVFGFVTMPTNQSSIWGGDAFHHLSDTADHFVVSWAPSGGGVGPRYAIVDRLTMTLTSTITPSTAPERFRDVRPGNNSWWSGQIERSAADLSTLRTIDYADWGYSLSSPVHIFDVLNNAVIVEIDGDEIAWLYLDKASGEGVTLRSIVEDVSERAGLDVDEDVDASDLTQTVLGYSTTQGTGKQWLEPLLEAHDSEVRPHDFKLQFLRRGAAVGAAIPVSSMGAGGSVRYEIHTLADTDLPMRVNLTFADVDRDQQPNTAIAQRAGAATDSRRELSLDASTMAIEADDARQKAEGYLRREWMRAQKVQTSLTRAYTALEPGDARSLVCDDATVSAKLKRLEFGADGVLTTEWERYAPAIHGVSGLAGAPADGMAPDVISTFGYTKGLALDIPLITDAHDSTTPFVYLAAAPYSDTAWPGATFYRSADGVDYDEELGPVASSEVAAIGYAMSALPDALSTVWDRTNAVTVKMFSGELASCTEAEAADGANTALLGDEVLRYTTATLVADQTYQISGFLRGRRGTERATDSHIAGDRFVLLEAPPRAAMGASDVGDTIYVRPTTSGGSDGFPQLLEPFEGAALKPYSPAHMKVTNSGGDKVVTWVRRTRVGGEALNGTSPPLGETTEAYVGQILDGSGAIIRTFSSLSSPTFTYTAAMIASDGSPAGVTARAMQVSSIVGNGYPSDAPL